MCGNFACVSCSVVVCERIVGWNNILLKRNK